MTKEKKDKYQLTRLVNMKSPEAVLEEIKYNFIRSYPFEEFGELRDIFNKYLGEVTETSKNDKKPEEEGEDEIMYGTDTALAFSRIVDGYNIKNEKLNFGKVKTGFIVCFSHNRWDAGIIHREEARESFELIQAEIGGRNFSGNWQDIAIKMLECTAFDTKIEDLSFENREDELLSYMVGTANILGQMSSRNYLEKLFTLYNRVKEAGIINADSVIYVLKRTVDFYKKKGRRRLEEEFNGLYKYTLTHFEQRYKIKRDLYMEAIEKQLEYLQTILEKYPTSYWEKLRRKL